MPQPPDDAALLILILDDDEVALELLELCLEQRGYRVAKASSVADALALARVEPPRLVIADLELPIADGFAFRDALELILPELPVIALSGTSDVDVLARAQAQFFELLHKPLDQQLLARAMDRAGVLVMVA